MNITGCFLYFFEQMTLFQAVERRLVRRKDFELYAGIYQLYAWNMVLITQALMLQFLFLQVVTIVLNKLSFLKYVINSFLKQIISGAQYIKFKDYIMRNNSPYLALKLQSSVKIIYFLSWVPKLEFTWTLVFEDASKAMFRGPNEYSQ